MATQFKKEILDVEFKGWDNSRIVSIVWKGKPEEKGIFISIVREKCRCRNCYQRLHTATEFAIKNHTEYCWVTNTELALEKAGLSGKETQIAVKIPLPPKKRDWKLHVWMLLGIEWDRHHIIENL